MSQKNVESIYPLSPMQQGLLFHTLYAPQTGVYVEQLTGTLAGDLDIPAFKQAWQEVIDRHSILRTLFVWERREKPLQVVRKRVTLPWEQQDWRGMSQREQARRLQAFIEADRARGFVLTQAPLLRLTLIQLAAETFHCLWSFHHMLLDGWSGVLVLKEVFACYEALHRRQALPPVRGRPYQDYIVWLQQQDVAAARAFWQTELAGFTAPTPLSGGRGPGHTPEQEGTYEEQDIHLSLASTTALHTLARRYHITLNTLLQGAWAILVSRYSGLDDIVFGTTVAGRPAAMAQRESMVGLFINTLPVRVRLSPELPLISWLQQIQDQQLQRSQYEYSPLVQIQEWSEVPRGHPLFESLLVCENYPADAAMQNQGGSIELRQARVLERSSYPLMVLAGLAPELMIKVNYETERFEAAPMRRMIGHVQTLLEGMVANPAQRLGEISLLTRSEQQQILAWNDTGREYPGNVCLHRLFEGQVEQTPDRLAVLFEEASLTYRALNERANQLAHHLRRLGVGPEVPVGVCMERSLELVIGLLGILKAGGAYVPFDPTYPAERLGLVMEDARIAVLLAQQHLLTGLPQREVQVVAIERSAAACAEESTANPVSGVQPENLAYIIYTSGSTGKPKGVMTTHRGICNRLLWMQETYLLAQTDRILQKTPFSFDVSVWEFFWPLLCGARVVVARPEGHRESAYLVEVMAWQAITVLHFVPSMLQVFLQEPDLAACRDLRHVICSGEALSFDLQERYAACLNAPLHNLYGPTEASIDVTSWACTRESNRRIVPIGRPIANTQIYLLDQYLHPVPAGVPGALYIGGVGLARGYIHHPAGTGERFIPHPFSTEPGARLYRTGDLARSGPDGALEFVGRLDDQVKLRGFRIEPGEIEVVLSQHPAVREAVVLAREDTPGEKRLVAYLVLSPGQAPAISVVRHALREQLPAYMLPAAFVVLEHLPLTANGKVDRRSLPAPDPVRSAETFVAPYTPLQEILAQIWADVLGLERVGIHDNFFALGGDSIRSIQILSRARAQGVPLSLQQLFQDQTISTLARELGSAQATALKGEPVQTFSLISADDQRRLPEDVADAYPLALLQAGMLFHSEYSPETAIYHDIFSFHVRAPFDAQAMQTVVQALVAQHAVLRTSFDLTSYSEPLQLVHTHADAPVEVADLRHLSPSAQEQALSDWMEAEKSQRIDWKHPPLVRFQVHRRGEDTFQLTLSLHHSILDGWSIASLSTRLFTSYLSLLRTGVLPVEAPLASEFRDFVALERGALSSEECRNFWLQKLADRPAATVPRREKDQRGAQRVRTVTVSLPPPVSPGLQRMARYAGVPLKSVLLAAHLRVLSLHSGQADILTGIFSHGRPEEIDSEHVLGLFLNTLPFRLQLDGGTWVDLVQRTLQAERELLPFRWYPLAELQRILGGQPLFETAFNFAHFHVYQGVLGLQGLQLLDSQSFEETNIPFVANFGLHPSSSEIYLRLDYDAHELSDAQVRAMGEHYANVLHAMADNQPGRYELARLLSPQEYSRLLGEWNDTRVPYPQEQCLHQLFAAQVETSPDALALVFESQQMTCGELNQRANQLAQYLRTLGVGPEVLVGVCIERSLELVIGLLGILKAGGAYVPLDPTYPVERLTLMLEDAQAPVLLTRRRLSERLPTRGRHVVCLDTVGTTLSQQPIHPPLPAGSAWNLAYVIYTSGSTGRPKGVMISHRNAVNLFTAMDRELDATAAGTWLAVTSTSFDISVLELLWTLARGFRVVIQGEQGLVAGTTGSSSAALEDAQEEYSLSAHMARYPISHLQCTPSLARVLLAEPLTARALRSLQTLLVGGEALPLPLARELCAVVQGEVRNMYGPTETTIWSASYRLGTQERSVPIGRPLANTQIYVLDRHLQPVPCGVAGGLYIGGHGLARGYLNRPDLTAEKFLPHPDSDEPGARLYMTGDVARYRPDGSLEFLGRTDTQVKIRGHRIELGEIEAVLGQLAEIGEAVVVAREDIPGEQQLVAYLVASQGQALRASEVRSQLKARLPASLVPEVFVQLNALPLTLNGKVNRRALPAPDTARLESAETYVAPRTFIEEMVARIWADVLGLHRIGIHDNFFEVGGHSLLAIQLVSRIGEAFQIEVPLRSLFGTPVVAAFASVIARRLDEAKSATLTHMLAEIEQLSDEEVRQILAVER